MYMYMYARYNTVPHCCNVCTICTTLYLTATMYLSQHRYVDAIRPGEYGVPRPFYFPFLPSYWMGRSYKITPLEVHVHVRSFTLSLLHQHVIITMYVGCIGMCGMCGDVWDVWGCVGCVGMCGCVGIGIWRCQCPQPLEIYSRLYVSPRPSFQTPYLYFSPQAFITFPRPLYQSPGLYTSPQAFVSVLSPFILL